MTVQNLYTKYLDGEISKQKFLYEVRRDSNLTMISPNNSFEDVVKILKNKSIISEKASKESKGKQEVEIIAKTIDMVNPYEYTKGMEYELNITDMPVTSGDLSEENIAKAQKKVLTNLTKNSRYYSEKMCGKGEVSEKWVEATKKEIEKIGKGKKNIMRENKNSTSDKYVVKYSKNNNTYQVWRGEEIITDFHEKERADKYAQKKNAFYNLGESFSNDKNSKITSKMIIQALQPLATKEEIKQYFQSLSKAGDKFDTVDDYVEDFKNYIADKSLEEIERPGYHPDGTPKSNDEMSDDEREAFYNDSDFLDEGGNLGHNELSSIHQEGAYWIVTYRGPKGTTEKSFTSEKEARKFQDGLNEHGQYADRVADVNADSSPLKEEAIYEKYAQKMGKTVDEVKAMVKEAIALKDKAGNTQYAKDPTEASNIEKAARAKGVILTKTQV